MTDLKKNQTRQFWVILLIVFLGFLGISIPYLIFPPLFLNLEYSFLPLSWGESSRALFLGVTLAAYPLGQFIGSPILGALSDDYGRKHLLSASLVVTAICNFFTALAIAKQHVGMLIISRFLAGLMEGNIAIARAMCADLNKLSKHDTFGKINAVTSIAYLIGPFLGGLMSDKSLLEGLTTSTPFFFICVLFVFLAGLSALVLKNSPKAGTKKARTLWQRFNFIKRMSALFSNQRLKTLMIASTCFTLAVDIFYEFAPVYLTVKWTLGPAQLIFYNGALCLGLAVGNGWLPAFTSTRTSNRRLIIGAIGGFAFFLTGIVTTNSHFFMLLGFGLCGLAIGLAVTLLTVNISDSVSDSMQGEVMGTQVSLRVLGDSIICLLGGVLLIQSSKIILVLAASISLVTMLYYKMRGKQ
ncbi:MAG TPA: MFS transporter [Parachlamydiales bacterium]|nr:MFS transporter [Parachlamydiales bacterium]